MRDQGSQVGVHPQSHRVQGKSLSRFQKTLLTCTIEEEELGLVVLAFHSSYWGC